AEGALPADPLRLVSAGGHSRTPTMLEDAARERGGRPSCGRATRRTWRRRKAEFAFAVFFPASRVSASPSNTTIVLCARVPGVLPGMLAGPLEQKVAKEDRPGRGIGQRDFRFLVPDLLAEESGGLVGPLGPLRASGAVTPLPGAYLISASSSS